jgi:hypothetical protein
MACITKKLLSMKKIILTVTGLFMLGLVCVRAQVDSVQQSSQEHTNMQQPSEQYKSEQLVRVPASQIPTSLRQTLKNPQYSGWENSTIYLDKSKNEYSLQLMDGNISKNYRFDQNGNAINDKTNIKTDVPPAPEAPATPEK